eukprot:TRINITY_DN778149_c0_g1_i1.p1 TRINITY_DN778149_c0_g1~~TRINITY_DN778149_c0_g1_i1.p1  ORF type:complete len:166 (+),score=20.76 TRINITY_DN778149_c0_g1_i1:140-637(+)
MGACFSGGRKSANDLMKMLDKTNSNQERGLVLLNLGTEHRQNGHIRKAIDAFEDAAKSLMEAGDLQSEEQARNSLSICYWSVGEAEKAGAHFERALLIRNMLTQPTTTSKDIPTSNDRKLKWADEIGNSLTDIYRLVPTKPVKSITAKRTQKKRRIRGKIMPQQS